MKTSFQCILLPALLLFIMGAEGQTNKNIYLVPQVDERVELLSIVFRLAGSGEYNSEQFKIYTNDIHHHFDAFKGHPLILFTRKLIKENHLGYDAVMSMAIALNPPPLLTPVMPFTNKVIDARWGTENANQFVSLLQKFYQDTHCKVFFKNHRKMFATLLNRFMKTNKIAVQWYEDFYGKLPDNQFNVIIGVGNGGGNYGQKIIEPGKQEQVYAIIGSWEMDSTGFPQYTREEVLPTIIHEFNHSFVNKLIKVYGPQLENSGKLIFREEEQLMRMQAYTEWKSMIMESVVRACVIVYLKINETDKLLAQVQLGEDESRGFIWTSSLVELLEQYEKNRTHYPTLESFMPEIVKFFDNIPAQIGNLKETFKKKCPQIVALSPIENNALNVEDTMKVLKIVFDKNMMEKYTDYRLSGLVNNPVTDKPEFDSDKRTLLVKIKLESKKEYGFILPAMRFRSQSGYGFTEDYPVYFATKGFKIKPNQEHFGYSIDDSMVTFVFEKPAALQFPEEVKTVSVAGDFNDWDPLAKGFGLTYKTKNFYQLTIRKEKLGKEGERKEFKFVVNGKLWIPISGRALNKVSHPNGNENLFIQL